MTAADDVRRGGEPGRAARRPWLLAFLGVVAGLVAAELFIRVVCPQGSWTPEVGISTNNLQMTEDGFHRLRPALATAIRAGWIDPVPIYTDEHGYRVPPAPYPRPAAGPDVENVFVIGASYTFGMGLPAEETWPFLLERTLWEARRPIRVSNAATPGYALPHMLSVLEHLVETGEALPDRVFAVMPMTGLYILGLGAEAADWMIVNEDANGFILGDAQFEDEFAYPDLEVVRGWLMRRDRPNRDTQLDWLRTESAVFHRAIVRYHNHLAPIRMVQRTRARDDAKLLRACQGLGRRLRAIAAKYHARGIPIHSILIPAEWKTLREPIRDHHVRFINAFAAEAGIAEGVVELVDLAGQSPWHVELDDSPGGDYLPHDDHYSPSGQRKVAETLARWYMTKRRLKPVPPR